MIDLYAQDEAAEKSLVLVLTATGTVDGNGNVAALVDAATGKVSAQYEYGPFGEPLRATGIMAKANPWRFSTKYQDNETGLLYYGYRWYDPSTGRFLSRDPIEEVGGLNIYAFVSNDPVDSFDFLGAASWAAWVQPHPGSDDEVVVKWYPTPSDLKCCDKWEVHRFVTTPGLLGFGGKNQAPDDIKAQPIDQGPQRVNGVLTFPPAAASIDQPGSRVRFKTLYARFDYQAVCVCDACSLKGQILDKFWIQTQSTPHGWRGRNTTVITDTAYTALGGGTFPIR